MRNIKEMDKRLDEREQEIERLHSIIKEAREYIENTPLQKGTEYYRIQLLEILDKE